MSAFCVACPCYTTLSYEEVILSQTKFLKCEPDLAHSSSPSFTYALSPDSPVLPFFVSLTCSIPSFLLDSRAVAGRGADSGKKIDGLKRDMKEARLQQISEESGLYVRRENYFLGSKSDDYITVFSVKLNSNLKAQDAMERYLTATLKSIVHLQAETRGLVREGPSHVVDKSMFTQTNKCSLDSRRVCVLDLFRTLKLEAHNVRYCGKEIIQQLDETFRNTAQKMNGNPYLPYAEWNAIDYLQIHNFRRAIDDLLAVWTVRFFCPCASTGVHACAWWDRVSVECACKRASVCSCANAAECACAIDVCGDNKSESSKGRESSGRKSNISCRHDYGGALGTNGRGTKLRCSRWKKS